MRILRPTQSLDIFKLTCFELLWCAWFARSHEPKEPCSAEWDGHWKTVDVSLILWCLECLDARLNMDMCTVCIRLESSCGSFCSFCWSYGFGCWDGLKMFDATVFLLASIEFWHVLTYFVLGNRCPGHRNVLCPGDSQAGNANERCESNATDCKRVNSTRTQYSSQVATDRTCGCLLSVDPPSQAKLVPLSTVYVYLIGFLTWIPMCIILSLHWACGWLPLPAIRSQSLFVQNSMDAVARSRLCWWFKLPATLPLCRCALLHFLLCRLSAFVRTLYAFCTLNQDIGPAQNGKSSNRTAASSR